MPYAFFDESLCLQAGRPALHAFPGINPELSLCVFTSAENAPLVRRNLTLFAAPANRPITLFPRVRKKHHYQPCHEQSPAHKPDKPGETTGQYSARKIPCTPRSCGARGRIAGPYVANPPVPDTRNPQPPCRACPNRPHRPSPTFRITALEIAPAQTLQCPSTPAITRMHGRIRT
jgi:hypothetical protein